MIDGVADAAPWASKQISLPFYFLSDLAADEPPYKWYRTWLSNTTDAYNMFLNGCFEVETPLLYYFACCSYRAYFQAGPLNCALRSANDETSYDIQKRLEDWLDDLFIHPMAVPNATMPSVLTAGQASSKSLLFSKHDCLFTVFLHRIRI